MAAKGKTVESNYTVHESVIVSIIRRAISGIPGMVRLAGTSLVSDLADLVGSKNVFDRSIQVNSEGDGSISVVIRITAEYGTDFRKTASEIQRICHEQITSFTGMKVKAINLEIFDVDDMPKEEAQDEAEATGDEASATRPEDDDPEQSIV